MSIRFICVKVKSWFCSCRSLVDTVYSLKDEVLELKQVSLQLLFFSNVLLTRTSQYY